MRRVILHGVDGSTWHMHGPEMGREGVFLTSLAGFYHPVRVPMSQTPAYMRGARPGPSKTDPTVTDMKMFTNADSLEEWEDIENAWWAALSDERDFTLEVEDRRGRFRSQPYRLQKYPDGGLEFEPEEDQEWTIPMIAYSPGWRSPTLTSSWKNTSGTGSGVLKFANPGDIEVWVEFAGWGVPGEVWTLPDGISGNTVKIPEFAAGEHWHIDTDQMQMPTETVLNTQATARMAALRFRFPIPPRTVAPVDVPVSVTGGSTTSEVKAYMTPLHMRPFT